MRFPEFKQGNTKTFHLSAPLGGIDMSENLHKSQTAGLADCQNVWLQNSCLKTRPALITDVGKVLNHSSYGGGEDFSYRACDLDFYVADSLKQTVLEEIDYDETVYICLTHFLNADGSTWKTARILFQRLNDSTFYKPYNLIFFKGAPIEGCGIYAIAYLANYENPEETASNVYELSGDYSSWEISNDMYVPTVYINGRGNKYEYVVATGQVYSGEPTRLEKLNILNSKFLAYYSTDGYSSSFRLPYANLDNNEVTGRLYYSISSYVEWVIPKGSSSTTAYVYNVEVTMSVNRTKGIVKFTVPAGDYEVPLIDDRNENNLRFSAHKSCSWDIDDLAACEHYMAVGKKILLAGGNTVFEADYNNPLYFPAESVMTVGESDKAITALATIGEKTVAFKERQIYILSLSLGKALNSISLLAENDAIFYVNDKLTAKCISKKTGCSNKKSVISENNRLFWRGVDGKFYSLNTSLDLHCVSENIEEFIKERFDSQETALGFRLRDYLVFIMGSYALALKYTVSHTDTDWFYWQLPENVEYAAVLDRLQEPIIICFNSSPKICFSAIFLEGEDSILSGNMYSPSITALPVSSVIKTKELSLGCDNALKNINAVSLRLKGEEATVKINGISVAEIRNRQNPQSFNPIKITTGLCGVDTVQIYLESSKPVTLGSIDIKYTPLGG